MLKQSKLPSVQHELIPFAGGVDLVTPAYNLAGGALRDCMNFAVNPQGGYYRIPGYERFNGKARPSDAKVTVLDVNFTGALPSVGDTITIDGVTAVVCGIGNVGQTFLAVTKYIGGMDVGALCKKDGVTFGTVVDWYGAATQKELAQYKAAAADIYRADIDPIPGSGPVRGVVLYKDVVYACRDNLTGTACEIYKSSSSGWVKVEAMKRFAFDSGTAVVKDGDTLTKSGVSVTIRRVQATSGQFVGGTAVGYIYVDATAPAVSIGTWHSSSGGNINVTTAIYESISLPPGGAFDFDIANFTADANTLRVYGCNPVGGVFEFDGTVLVKLSSLPAKHIRVHKNHLFLSVGASLVHSGTGDPYRWDVIDGAGEIGVGDAVTNMLVQPGTTSSSAMAVYGRSTTWILYGSSVDDWNFVAFNVGMGGIDFTAQNMSSSYVLDDRGVVALSTSLNYGNFDTSSITYNIRPFIKSKRALAAASSINRDRSQYRVFFSDGFGLYSTIVNGQLAGHAIVQYADPVRCYCDGEYSDGDGVGFFGTDSGHVMMNDVGTSFDGEIISAQFITNINTEKTPRIHKRFRRCVLELQGDSYCEFSVGYNLDWASMDKLQHSFETGSAAMSPIAYWDTFFWDNFYWDGRGNAPDYVELNGSGENIQIIVSLDSNSTPEFSINSAILHYTPRRSNR